MTVPSEKSRARRETMLASTEAEIKSIVEQQQKQSGDPDCERVCANNQQRGLDICIRSCANYSFCKFVATNQNMPFMYILNAGIKMIGVPGLQKWHESGGCAICNPNLVCDKSHTECIEAAALECKTCVDNSTWTIELATRLGKLRWRKQYIEDILFKSRVYTPTGEHR